MDAWNASLPEADRVRRRNARGTLRELGDFARWLVGRPRRPRMAPLARTLRRGHVSEGRVIDARRDDRPLRGRYSAAATVREAPLTRERLNADDQAMYDVK